MDVDKECACFFSKRVPQVACNEEYISFCHLLESDNETPIDCRSELEHLLLLAGCYEIQPTNLYNEMICSNHHSSLMALWRRRNNCHLCVDVFNKKKRSNASLQRVTKQLALRVWNERRLNVYYSWACTQCRKACNDLFSDVDVTKDPFEWLYDGMTIHTPSTAGSFFSQYGSEYEMTDVDMSPSVKEKGKKEFKMWLASTGYQGRWRSTNNYASLSKHDQAAFRSQMKAIFRHTLHQLASNDVDTVWDDWIDEETRKPTKIKSGDYAIVMKSLKDAYATAEHWSTKRQLLSIIAADLPTHLLKVEFPGLTDWKIRAARAQAFFCGRGVLPETARGPIERYTERQLTHFIQFIQSPHITTDMPFGERKLKLSTGEKILVPDVIRNVIPSRIVSQYLAYCQETAAADDFIPLRSSSLFAILKRCGATTRKCLAGLDNFSCDGSTAFDQLRNLCDELATYGIKPEKIVRVKQDLHDGRNYLKLDYRTHISSSSRVADHCSTFGLSDPHTPRWRQTCDHEHDEECDGCLRLRETFAELFSIIEENIGIADDKRQRLRYRLEQNIQYITEWKKHLLRTVHQDGARKDVLDQLDNTSVFIVADWAMKWLPTRYRESQRDFFGKRGLPWHITYAIRLRLEPSMSASSSSSTSSSSESNRVFEHRTFCHVFDCAKQDGRTVTSILCNVLKELKQAAGNLTTAYIRTDNAGCYKGTDTLLAIEQLYKLTGILVRRFDFSDPQSGKGPCDRMAAVTKANIRRFVNEKNDCVTSSDFVRAAKSTQYMAVMACRLSNSCATNRKSWQGIQNYNNIQYEFVSNKVGRCIKANDSEIRVTVWRAVGIGPCEVFQLSKINTSKINIAPIEISVRHDSCEWQADSVERGVQDDDDTNNNVLVDEEALDVDVPVVATERSSSFVTFDCPEPHCIKQFRREDRLRAHLLLDSHKIIMPPFRLLDKAVVIYKDLLISDSPKQIPVLSMATATDKIVRFSTVSLNEGWALFRPRAKVAFTVAQKSYLNEKYNEGEKSGAKWDAVSVAEHMQTAKSQDQFLFEPDQFLTPSQIKSYFSRLTRERRRNGNDSQMVLNESEALSTDFEDLQLQAEEDISDFDSALSDTQTYQILDDAIHVLDDLLLQKESN